MTSSPAVARPTRLLVCVAVFAFVMTPLIGYLAPLGFAPLLSLCGLLAIPALGRVRSQAWPLLILLLLALWGAISLAWSPAAPDPSDLRGYGKLETFTALKLLLQTALYGAAIVALRDMSARSNLLAARVMTVGLLLLTVLVSADALSGTRIYQQLRLWTHDPIRPDLAIVKISLPTYALALLLWPAALVLVRHRVRSGVVILFVGTIVSAALLSADAAVAALLLGGVVWGLVRAFGRRGAYCLVPLAAGPFILTPLATLWAVHGGLFSALHRHVPQSWDARLNIWAFAADRIQAHPLRGWGLDASRTFGAAIPLHTHNAALQIWLELGGVGAALAGAFFGWIAYAIVRMADQSRSEAAMAAGALVSYLVIGGLSFGVWQEWWLALGALTFIACNVARRATPVFATGRG